MRRPVEFRRAAGLALVTSILPCVGPPAAAQDPQTRLVTPPPVDAAADSASDELNVDELDLFRPGRPMDEILRELRWRGNFEMAAEVDGKPVAAVSFTVRPVRRTEVGEGVWAVFVADRFEKFVKPEPRDHKHSIPIGTFPPLRAASGAPPVAVAAIKQSVSGLEGERPAPFDAGALAVATVLDLKYGAGLRQSALENGRLRGQFNAARLRLGMTRAEVAAALKSRPLEAGPLEAGSYEIYNDVSRYFQNPPLLHYNGVLALYAGDRLTGIYSGRACPGDPEGMEHLRKAPAAGYAPIFTGLPPAPEQPKPR